ncbi:hypothetical protein KGQ19_26710 [Catenulispora sp. NL8]|uniref:Uncharacterized protein n=1 Tax=Catenulispora pinistramenti TaxID=2705254 RepID=A0ABS5KWM6_9ACTN|nr:hypothetical protein [Catenulispora pinistramenti]MBS2550467.1 hypothetical protein [Catenulispora pinistramenti]
MTLISVDPYVPQHANRSTATQTGEGSGYLGTRRKQEPAWFLALLDGVMQANRVRAASGYVTDLKRR